MDRRCRENGLSRREVLAAGAAAAAAAPLIGGPAGAQPAAEQDKKKRRIKQSFAWGIYMRRTKDPLARIKTAAEIGFASIEMGPEKYWKAIQDAGMQVAIFGGNGSLGNAFANPKNWDRNEREVLSNIKRAEKYGIKSLLLLTGNRQGRSDAECLDNCTTFLKRVIKAAEQAKIRLCPELLNSKVNHPDYFLDHAHLGIELCTRINSPMIGLTYDIYHMQIMDGDLIRTITKNIQHIGHFHTGGNPGRRDMDDQQEIYYPAVMRAIAKTDYQGFVGHEFGPKGRDIVAAMKRNFAVCDV
jgi:hydroxypyruvate isomerase